MRTYFRDAAVIWHIQANTASLTVFGYEITHQPEFYHSKQRQGVFNALRELEQVNLVESSSLYKATKLGRELTRDKDFTVLWQGICQERLTSEEEQLLKTVNKLSTHAADCLASSDDWVLYGLMVKYKVIAAIIAEMIVAIPVQKSMPIDYLPP